MAKVVKKNKMVQQAVKIFADRVEVRQVFWNAYEKYKEIMNEENAEVKGISYYGIGGIGKSRLLAQLQEELEGKKESYCVKVDFNILEDSGMIGCFEHIWKVLKHKYHFSFPLYAAGLVRRAELKQMGEKINEDVFRSYLGETADDFLDLVEGMEGTPFMEFIPKTVRLVAKGSKLLSEASDNDRYKQEIKRIQSRKTIPEIDKLLPYLLGQDIERNLIDKKEPLVIFLDSYEKLIDESADVGDGYLKDEWIKGDDGLLVNTPKTLWIIAGREKLKWSEYDPEWSDSLEQHLMNNLSEPDATEYLATAKIPEVLWHDLYELTHGVPLLLDLSVDIYYWTKEKGEEPTIDKIRQNDIFQYLKK